MSKPHLAIRIPPSLLVELNSYVEEVGASKTDVVVSAIATYFGCAEAVPLSQRVSGLELQMKELRTLVKSYSCTKEVTQ